MQSQVFLLLLCGILSVKGTPFYPDVSSIDLLKADEVHQPLEFDGKNLTSASLDSNKPLEVAGNHQHENSSIIIQGSIMETEIIFESIPLPGHGHGHGHGHGPRKMGPVELGLRNVVSASSIAAEEIYMEMAAMNSETLEVISAKSEILTSQAMNAIFKPLSMAEGLIKKNQDCDRQFADSFNAILGQVQDGLKACVYNLTMIGETYKNESSTIMSSIARAAEDMHNLPESCEMADNFEIGTFCVVINLGETNTRVVLDVKNMRQLNAVAKEHISNAVSSTVVCQKHLVEKVSEKLNKLYQEVSEKCAQAKPQNVDI